MNQKTSTHQDPAATDVDIDAGNRIIGEFEGWRYSDTGKTIRRNTGGDPHKVEHLKYHSDWQQLMPVWRKLTDMLLLHGLLGHPEIRQRITDIKEGLIDVYIEEVWEGIIEIIQWYKKQRAEERTNEAKILRGR